MIVVKKASLGSLRTNPHIPQYQANFQPLKIQNWNRSPFFDVIISPPQVNLLQMFTR